MARLHPRESLILIPAQDGVPNPLDLRECLRRFLTFYGVPFDPELPAFYLRAGDGLVTPNVPAFVIRPNQESPESLYEWLERFFGPFRGYAWRADTTDRLVVTPPAWVDTLGLRLTVYRRRQPGDRLPTVDTLQAPWSTSRAPRVEWIGQVDGAPVSGSLQDPLTLGVLEVVTIAGISVRLTWTAGRVQVMVWPQFSVDVSVGPLFNIAFTFRPDGGGPELLELTNADLAPGEIVTTSSESVYNRAILPIRTREFTPDQQVMQAAALVLQSPAQVIAGSFGNNPVIGPWDWEIETPSGFLELVNDSVQSGSWFWPADETVVAQPGGVINVSYDVEEWAEMVGAGSLPADPLARRNTFNGTATLPASGVEVKLFDFQFPRQTSDFAPSPFGARGTVWARWVAGDTSGVQVRVGNSRFFEFGYKTAVLIFGETTYYAWAVVVKLNGTGIAFTEGRLDTVRFGFARGDDGLWEGEANVPALAESQALYPDRVFNSPELPYAVSLETGLAIARGIVEENLTPKVVYRLPLAPSRSEGWALRPHHLGAAARVRAPGLQLDGRVVSIEYDEAHTPLGSTTNVVVEVEVAEAPEGSRAASQTFARSAYGVSSYPRED